MPLVSFDRVDDAAKLGQQTLTHLNHRSQAGTIGWRRSRRAWRQARRHRSASGWRPTRRLARDWAPSVSYESTRVWPASHCSKTRLQRFSENCEFEGNIVTLRQQMVLKIPRMPPHSLTHRTARLRCRNERSNLLWGPLVPSESRRVCHAGVNGGS